MGAPQRVRVKADYIRILTAAGTSLLGDGVRTAALSLLAAALSPTPAAVGIVTFAGTAPMEGSDEHQIRGGWKRETRQVSQGRYMQE